MTTVAQVRTLVKPLLDRHADLALVGRFMFVKPAHHFVRAVLIDRTAYKDDFEPRWAVTHLFELRDFFALTYGEFIDDSPRRFWRASDPDVGPTMVRLIENDVLPMLRAMTTLEDYIAYVSSHFSRHAIYERDDRRMILEVALGNLDVATEVGRRNIHLWSRPSDHLNDEDRRTWQRLRTMYERLEANDRPALVDMLHAWEEETVKNLKIAHIWERTPFPLEIRSR